MGKFKICPFCKEQIRAEAVKCRFCGEWLAKPFDAPVQANAPPESEATPTELQTSVRAQTSDNKAAANGFANGGSLDKDSALWPSKGVLWWAAAQTLMLLYLNVAVYGKLIVILGVLSVGLSATACFWWYRISKKRQRRKPLARILGYILFGMAILWLSELLPTTWALIISDGFVQPVISTSALSLEASRAAASHLNGRAALTGTLLSLAFLLFLAGLFVAAYFLQFKRQGVLKPPQPLIGHRYGKLPIVAACVVLIFLLLVVVADRTTRQPLRQPTASRSNAAIPGFNSNALKGWEIMKKGDRRIADADGVFTPAAKKKMREMFALELKGDLADFGYLKIELQGDEHDRLVLSFDAMNAEIASNVTASIQQSDVGWGNRMRFLCFAEFILTGTNYYESIPRARFTQSSHDYETFLSNMVATYEGTGSSGSLYSDRGNELNPMTQRTMRQTFSSGLKGSLKTAYSAIDVKLEGEGEDKLVFYISEMNSASADGLLKSFHKSSTFWNGLRAMGFGELIFRGDNYHRSIPRKEFIMWCQNYEKYLSEIRKATEQMSGAMKREPTAP